MANKFFGKLHRLDRMKTVFLMCDIQEKFSGVMPLFDGLVKNSNKLVLAGKEFKIPLIVSEQYPEKLGNTCKAIDICHASAVIPKTYFSMFVPEMVCKFKEIFKENPADAVLFGLETHVCIQQTAIDLIKNGINVFLVADCCCSRLNQDRNIAIQCMTQLGCIPTTSESVIFNLLEDKNSPFFDKTRKLIAKPSEDMKLE